MTIDGRCLNAFCEPLDRPGAFDACQGMGAQLARINNVLDNNYVSQLHGAQGTWIDGTDELNEGQWIDVNGNQLSYFNWANNEPDNWTGASPDGQNCVFTNMGGGGWWGDIQCDYVLPCYACEQGMLYN